MQYDNRNPGPQSRAPAPQTLYRGLYIRIARKLGVDPSYVSRVARGERCSAAVEKALSYEIADINQKLGGSRGSAAVDQPAQGAKAGKRLSFFVKRDRQRLRQEWLQQSAANPSLRRRKISARKRVSSVPALVEEAMQLSRFSPKKMLTRPRKAGEQHGRARRAQGYSADVMVEEYNLVRRCLFKIAEKHFHEMDPYLLLHDLAQVGEAIDLQMQNALSSFLGRA
jgi:hypothetical protein